MRHVDWQDKFWVALTAQTPLPFEYGVCDCVLFAARMADAISIDGQYVQRARDMFEWSDGVSAAKLLETPLQELVEHVLGPMQSWVRLGQGDLLLCDSPEGHIMAVHDGTTPVGKAHRRLTVLSMSQVLGGWRVG